MDEILDGRMATGDEATGINATIRAMATEEADSEVSENEGPQVVPTPLPLPTQDGRAMIAAGKKRRIEEREEARVVKAAADAAKARVNLEARKRSASNKEAAEAKKVKKIKEDEVNDEDEGFIMAMRETIKGFRDDIRSIHQTPSVATNPLSRAMALLNRDFAELSSSQYFEVIAKLQDGPNVLILLGCRIEDRAAFVRRLYGESK